MGYYPLFLRLERLRVLLVGAGGVGRRKAADLIGGASNVDIDETPAGQDQKIVPAFAGKAPAGGDPEAGSGLPEDFLWLDPEVDFAELAALPEFFRLRDGTDRGDKENRGGHGGTIIAAGAEEKGLTEPAERAAPRLVFERRCFRPADLEGRDLVFAATGSRACNAALARLCAERRILCNVIDAPEEGSFIVPAHFKQDSITLALSTGGRSPALARRLRQDLQAWLGGRYGPLLALLARLRPLVLSLESDKPDCELFRSLVNSDLAEALHGGNAAEAERILRELLPAVLHPCIREILHEPC